MTDDLNNEIEYPDPSMGKQLRAEDIFGKFKTGHIKGFFPSISTPPVNTDKPKSFLDQIRFYNNGLGAARLYYYDFIYAGWDYITISGQV